MKTIINLLLPVLLSGLVNRSNAQVAISPVEAHADPSAMLDVSSENKGVLIPRMRMGQRDSIISPATGLMIYQHDTLPGLYIYNNGWKSVSDNLGNHTLTQGLNTMYSRIYSRNSQTGLKLDEDGGLTLRTKSMDQNALPSNIMSADRDGGLLMRGRLGYGIIPASGAGERMMWYPFKASFRAGSVNNYQWDDYSNGFYSAAFGVNTIASGYATFAAGDGAAATGSSSVAIGYSSGAEAQHSYALGYNTQARASFSYALGAGNQAFGVGSAVVGIYNDSVLTAPQTGVTTNTPLFIVGNGDNSTTRSNALVVQKDGRIFIDPNNKNNGVATSNALMFGTANGSGEGIGSKRTTGGNQYGLDLYTNFTSRLTISNNGNVGIGTTPVAKFDLLGGNNWNLNSTEGDMRIGNGTYRLKFGVALAGAGAGGVGIMQYGQTGGYNVLALGAQGNNVLFINGNSANVGIGTDNATQKLTVAGNICASGSIGSCSDIRYKTNIKPVTNALTSVNSLHGIYYNWKPEFKDKGFSTDRQLGFSAQEVEKYFPEMVQTDKEGYKSVDYSRMTPVLVEAIKELKKNLEEKDKKVELLEARLQKLEEAYKGQK